MKTLNTQPMRFSPERLFFQTGRLPPRRFGKLFFLESLLILTPIGARGLGLFLGGQVYFPRSRHVPCTPRRMQMSRFAPLSF